MRYLLLQLTFLPLVADCRPLSPKWVSAIRRDSGHPKAAIHSRVPFGTPRGGYQAEPAQEQAEENLDEKVRRAMEKLGLVPPSTESASADANCDGGVCSVPPATAVAGQKGEQDPEKLADEISTSMQVDRSLAMAAVAATATEQGGVHVFNEVAARQMILQEIQAVRSIPEDLPQVEELVKEGHPVFEVRRALAFAEGNIDNARAILVAEQEEAGVPEEEKESTGSFKTVEVQSNFDPTKIQQPKAEPTEPTKPAERSQVVFEAACNQIQELVIESPVPVLLDIYADWCGPCKVLGPALEEMAIKSGGAFRLVKVNTDNERPVSSALKVTALPTVFGIKNGKIVNMFQGMPRSQEAMQSFMMGLLVGESHINPPLTEEQKNNFSELSNHLIKIAGSSAFPFSASERLQDRIKAELDKLLQLTRDFSVVDESSQILKSLLTNIIRDPYNLKFRSVKLDNKIISAKIKQYPACLAVLRMVGFSAASSSELALQKNKPVVNIAPLLVARDAIDKWLDASWYEAAKAARKHRDELDRVRVQKELEDAKAVAVEEEDTDVPVDTDACTLKVRIEGKKKIYQLDMRADDKMEDVMERLPVSLPAKEELKVICAAKRLVISASDEGYMKRTLRDLGLFPAASLVVAAGESSSSSDKPRAKLSERVAKSKKKKTKGTHTLQSVGIYAKDDNAKGEMFDGGGGVLYEHDVSDDEEDPNQKAEGDKHVPEDEAQDLNEEPKDS